MRRALVVLPAVVLLGLLGAGLFRSRPAVRLGEPAPSFALPELSGRGSKISLASLRGMPTVINFWASWCAPCRDEAPELASVARAHATDVRFLGVNILDGRAEALGYVRRFGIGYPSVRDASGSVAKRYLVTGAPETVFLDAGGRVVGRYVGAFVPGQLDPIVRDLIALRPGDVLSLEGRGESRPVP